jgi:S-adenosylmethionine/arginine decarboxylase-like enzyme
MPLPSLASALPSSTWALATADVLAVPAHALEDVEGLATRLGLRLGAGIGAPVWHVHRFAPHGASLVGTAPLGRVIVHTWPERRALTMDLYAAARDAERLLAACVEEVAGEARSARASQE